VSCFKNQKLLSTESDAKWLFGNSDISINTVQLVHDWINRLDSILQLNGRELLTHAGKISHEAAVEKSNEEFEKYKLAQKLTEKEQSLKEIEADIKRIKKE
jgi:hypothetical protein